MAASAIANLLGTVNANGALLVTLDGGSASATTFVGPAADNTAAPPFTFSGDLNTGVGSSAADVLSLVTGGSVRLSVSSTAVTSGVPILAPDGTVGAPSISFSGAPTTGFYRVAAERIGISILGSEVGRFNGSGLAVNALILDAANQDVSLSRGAANRLDLAAGDSFNLVSGSLLFTGNTVIDSSRNFVGAGYYLGSALAISGTAPTVTSAGTSPSVTASNGTAAFRVNVGTGGTATTIVMAMPAASTGWNAFAENITATAANRANQRVVVTASTTTSLTLQNQTISTGAALAFTASDIVQVIATAF